MPHPGKGDETESRNPYPSPHVGAAGGSRAAGVPSSPSAGYRWRLGPPSAPLRPLTLSVPIDCGQREGKRYWTRARILAWISFIDRPGRLPILRACLAFQSRLFS